MAATQYLVPGGAFVNEDTNTLEFLVPGGAYLDETSVPAAIVGTLAQTLGAVTLTAAGTVVTGGLLRRQGDRLNANLQLLSGGVG